MRRLQSLLVLAPLALAIACSGTEPDIAPDPSDPVLTIASPERGTVAGEDVLVVRGTATDLDSGVAGVSVNGTAAILEGDQFRAEISLTPGINTIETVASDKSGNQTVDVRAALRGEFAAPGAVDDALAVRLGPGALRTIGDTAATAIASADLEPTIATVNPVLDKGGSCLGARADVTSIEFGALDISIVPIERALSVAAQVSDLAVGVHLDYDIACIGGRRDIVTSAASVTIGVTVEAGVSGDAFVFDTTEASVSLEDVDLGIGGLPTALIELIVGDIEEKIADALESVLIAELEPRLQASFDQLLESRTVTVLGRELTITAVPRTLQIAEDGVDLTISSNVAASGAASTGYVASREQVPTLSGELGAAIADDAINQALGTLWASGALAREIPLSGDSGADLGAGIADSIAIDALLPPTISFEDSGGARIEIADLIVSLSREGSAVSDLAVSAVIEVNVVSDGAGIVLRASEPELLLQRLTPDGFLNESDVNILGAFLSNYLHGDLDALIGEIPLPAFAGTTVADVSAQPSGGYLTLVGSLRLGAP